MIKFIKKLFTRQTLEVGDILVKDSKNPYQQTKIKILDVSNNYALWKFLVIDGTITHIGIEHSDKIKDLFLCYKKQD